ARLGALPIQRLEARCSSESYRQLVGSTLNLTKKETYLCQLQPPHLLRQKLLPHQRSQKPLSRTSHCLHRTATSTTSTKPCRRKNSPSLSACANSWKPK